MSSTGTMNKTTIAVIVELGAPSLLSGHCGAGQQYRVLGYAPAPHHGHDPERDDDPDAASGLR